MNEQLTVKDGLTANFSDGRRIRVKHISDDSFEIVASRIENEEVITGSIRFSREAMTAILKMFIVLSESISIEPCTSIETQEEP
jgi:hypothetical protein